LYEKWFEPSPIDFAHELEIADRDTANVREISYYIAEIKRVFEKTNQQGRLASMPISPQILFPLAAAEYGIKWMKGEASKDEIDLYILEQILINLISEYTGLQKRVTVTRCTESGVILILPEYLIY
jgi:hypothetical protein